MKKLSLIIFLLTAFLFSCKKDKPPVAEPIATAPNTTTSNFLLVCNEGVFPNGEASISRVETDPVGRVGTRGTRRISRTPARRAGDDEQRPLGAVPESPSALSTKVRAFGLCGLFGGSAPAAVFLGADSGSFAALRREEFGGSSVRVAPMQIGVQSSGQHRVVGVARVVQHELA